MENIKCFCIPETRFNPGSNDWNLPAWQGVVWHGFIHAAAENAIGKVYWYALVKNAEPDRISINVIRGNDHWHLETVQKRPDIFTPLSAKEVLQRRLVTAVSSSIEAYRWGALPEQKRNGKPEEGWELHSAFSWYFKDTFADDPAGVRPTRLTRRILSPDNASHELVVSLGKDALPEAFLLDGKKDEYMRRLYATFTTNYSSWLRTLVYGYERASPNADMSWEEHLEALGLGEESIRYLSAKPLAAGVLPPSKGKRHQPSQGPSQPDYRAWKKIAKGMTEVEVFNILGPPQVKEWRHMIGGYKWHYGTVVPKSQVVPQAYEFQLWFLFGRVDVKEDPFNGRFSETGLPSKPELIHPADGEVFAHYPRFVDLRWYPCSGEYPLHYEIKCEGGGGDDPFGGGASAYAVAAKTTTEPYAAATVCGMGTVTWRVRAVNAKGKSEWSEPRSFKCER
jgi:hypothetical protein